MLRLDPIAPHRELILRTLENERTRWVDDAGDPDADAELKALDDAIAALKN